MFAMMDDRPRDEIVSIIDQIIKELLEQAGVEEPPVDAIKLAQGHLGMTVSLDSRQQERGRVQRAGKNPKIFLRPEPTEERHQFSVAREVARHLKSQILERLDLDPQEAKQLTGESLLSLFSSHLLVPTHWFQEDAPATGYDLPALKERYRTASHEVIALRFLDLPQPCIVTVIDNETITRRKSNGPRCKAKMLEPAEEKCWRSVHQTGKARTLREGGWTVQCWPVHREDWKREILRSVVEE